MARRRRVKHDARELHVLHQPSFDLSLYDQPISYEELKALLYALNHNRYFLSLRTNGVKLSEKDVLLVGDVLKVNRTLQELSLAHAGVTKEGVAVMATSIRANRYSALNSVNLSGNLLEDRGAVELAAALGSLPQGLVELNLAETGLGKVNPVPDSMYPISSFRMILSAQY